MATPASSAPSTVLISNNDNYSMTQESPCQLPAFVPPYSNIHLRDLPAQILQVAHSLYTKDVPCASCTLRLLPSGNDQAIHPRPAISYDQIRMAERSGLVFRQGGGVAMR